MLSLLLVFMLLSMLFSGVAGSEEPLPTAPAAPTGLTATADTSSQISLSWTYTSDNEEGFRIERKTGSEDFTQIQELDPNSTSFTDTGLATATSYTYRVYAYNSVGDSLSSNEANATTLAIVPAAPSGLTATAVSSSRIDLAWTNNAANESGFKIERKETNGTFTQITTVGAGMTSYSNTGLAYGTTYTYRVSAFNSGGDSAFSNEASATTVQVLPAAPSGLTATAVSASQINLSWTDNADNESGFKIERRTGSGAYEQIAAVGANTTTYQNTGLSANTAYTYRVKAYNDVGDSAYSNTAAASTLSNVPAAPSGLSATAVSASRIDLVWTDNANNETGFRIERKTGAGSFVFVANVGANVTTYANTSGLNAGTAYTYRVRAFNTQGDSAYSNEASATTPGNVPAAPSGLTATGVSGTQVNLAWNDNSNNELGFKIERKTPTSSFTEIALVGVNARTYTDTGLNVNTTYTYRVRAYNAAGNSAYSNEATNITGILPFAPSNLVATTVSTSRIDLTWTDNANNESGFRIERKHGTGAFTEIGTVGANVTSYANTGLTNNREYTYRVRAYNAAGNSAYSNESSATTGTLPAAPTNLKAEALSDTQVRLTWEDRSNNESGFRIERKKGTGSYTLIATVSANTVSYTNTGLERNTEYTYRVRAYNATGNSAYSNEARIATAGIPAAPANLTAAAAANNRIVLGWADRSGDESGFRIERKLGTGNYALIATVGANTTTYTDTNAAPGTRYTYRVRAYNAVGNSAYSNEASATTPQQVTQIKLRVGQTSYQVNGRNMVMDTSPIIREARTLLPIRFVAEALGARVDWNVTEQKATITLENNRIELWVGANMARVNGVHRMIDPDNSKVVPVIVPPGRTMMPLRFISESLGCAVDWNEQTKEITVTYPAP